MRPATRARKPWATVLIPHGGPHGAISDEYGRLAAQVFCARGYAVFMPNFRGSTGYGTDFMLAILRNWGGAPADDIMRGLDLLVRRRLVDRKRVVVHGGSYGGYMTAWLIGHYRNRFRAAVAHAPVVNNISMWGTTDIPSFKEWSYGGRPLTTFKLYWQQSPISGLAGCKTPTMVVTGDVDLRVPVGQSQELYRTLQAEGAPTKLVRYPREPHGVGEPRHKVDFIKRVLAWFDEHLGEDSPEP
jgi:dipeptidyl aminopeptidase/acylaminoacyl peptidase